MVFELGVSFYWRGEKDGVIVIVVGGWWLVS